MNDLGDYPAAYAVAYDLPYYDWYYPDVEVDDPTAKDGKRIERGLRINNITEVNRRNLNAERMVYRPSEYDNGRWWFGGSPTSAAEILKLEIEPGKLRNLISLADGDLNLWYLLEIANGRPKGIVDEYVNFILGPIAAALKSHQKGFEGRWLVLEPIGFILLVEALELDLIPSGKRKEFYEGLITGFNKAYLSMMGSCNFDSDFYLKAARTVFYDILATAIEPIFSEASGDQLSAMVTKALLENSKQAEAAKNDPKVVGWLMGQIMRGSPTKLDPNTVRAAILEQLKRVIS